MVQLAKQLIDRQTTAYDPSDLEDHYETRLRAMIDAKLKGEGLDVSEPEEPERGNVIDLMAALKKSLGQSPRAETGQREEAGQGSQTACRGATCREGSSQARLRRWVRANLATIACACWRTRRGLPPNARRPLNSALSGR